jgi:hypothetical protein
MTKPVVAFCNLAKVPKMRKMDDRKYERKITEIDSKIFYHTEHGQQNVTDLGLAYYILTRDTV